MLIEHVSLSYTMSPFMLQYVCAHAIELKTCNFVQYILRTDYKKQVNTQMCDNFCRFSKMGGHCISRPPGNETVLSLLEHNQKES